LEWTMLSNGELSTVRRITEIEAELELSDLPLSCMSTSNGTVIVTTQRFATFVLDPLSSPSIVARHHRPPVAVSLARPSKAPHVRDGRFFASGTLDSRRSVGLLTSVEQMKGENGSGHDILVTLFPAERFRGLPQLDESRDSQLLRIGGPVPSLKIEPVKDARRNGTPSNEGEVWIGMSRNAERAKSKTKARKKRLSNRVVIV
jgi:hypothetical protein